MDIVLNTNFNNPNLPIIPVPGFSDNFNRASADTLGSTLDGKTWEIFNGGVSTSTWGTYGDGTAGMKAASSSYHFAAVESFTPNGTLVAKLGTYDAAQRRPGLVIRAKDKDNFISIAPASATAHGMRIAVWTAGTNSTQPGVGPEIAAGDTVTVETDGPNITVSLNGVVALTMVVPEHTDATLHGMYGFTGAVGTWDSIEFVPA